jgi:hypothetical protein
VTAVRVVTGELTVRRVRALSTARVTMDCLVLVIAVVIQAGRARTAIRALPFTTDRRVQCASVVRVCVMMVLTAQVPAVVMWVGRVCCVTAAYQHSGARPATSHVHRTALRACATLGPVGTEAACVTWGGLGRLAQSVVLTIMGRCVLLARVRLVERVEMVWAATVPVYVTRDGPG